MRHSSDCAGERRKFVALFANRLRIDAGLYANFRKRQRQCDPQSFAHFHALNVLQVHPPFLVAAMPDPGRSVDRYHASVLAAHELVGSNPFAARRDGAVIHLSLEKQRGQSGTCVRFSSVVSVHVQRLPNQPHQHAYLACLPANS
jgi:hypothetical protein